MQVGPYKIADLSRALLSLFFTFAGINHFWHPEFYLPLIPDYLPFPALINTLSGVAEISLGIGMALPRWRKWATYGLIALLVAFIPSHVYFIHIGSCVPEGLCTPPWVAWVRLLVIQPLFMWWVWVSRK